MGRRTLYSDNGGMGCRTVDGVHVPGCMGCAVYGHSRCTCSPNPPNHVIERIEKLEEQVKKLIAAARPEKSHAEPTEAQHEV